MRIEGAGNISSPITYNPVMRTPDPHYDYIRKSREQMVNAPYYKPSNIYGTGGPDPVAVTAWAAPMGVNVYAAETDRDPGDSGLGIDNGPAPGGSTTEDPEEPPEEGGFDWMGMIMMMMLLGGGIGGGGMLGGLFGGKEDQQVTQEGGVTINIGQDDDHGENWI